MHVCVCVDVHAPSMLSRRTEMVPLSDEEFFALSASVVNGCSVSALCA